MKLLKEFPGRASRSSYAWLGPLLREKAVGKPILLEQGEDFQAAPETMRGQVYVSAKEAGLKAQVRLVDGGLAVLCELRDDPAQEKLA